MLSLGNLPIPNPQDPTQTLMLSRLDGLKAGHVYTCGYGNHGQVTYLTR